MANTHTITGKPEYLSSREVSVIYGIQAKTLEMWRWRGVGPKFRKFGRLVRYSVRDLEEWAEDCKRSNSGESS